MTVREALEEMKGQKIRLGAKGGSAFIYCGLADPDEAEKAGKAQKKEALKLLQEKTKSLRGLAQYLRSLPEGALPAECSKRIMRKARSLEPIGGLLDRLIPWVDIMDRQVTETYPSIAEQGVTIIIFEGCERGQRWW